MSGRNRDLRRHAAVFAPPLQICQKLVTGLQHTWQKRRKKQIQFSEDVIRAIALKAHTINQKSGGKEGGRIVRKLLSELVVSRIQSVAAETSDAYKRSRVIRIEPVIDTTRESNEGQLDNLQVYFEI